MALTQEQLNERIAGNWIGASDAAVILGLSKFKTPDRLWAEMIGLLDREDGNAVTRRGQKLERAILDMAEEFTGSIRRDPPTLKSVDGIRCANLDGQTNGIFATPCGDELCAGTPVEAKSSRMAMDWGDEWTSDIPIYYQVQMIQQLDIAREFNPAITHGVLAALLPNYDLRMYVIPFDADAAAAIRDQIHRFRECVDKRIPPTDFLTYDVARSLRRERRTVAIPDDFVAEYLAAKDAQDAADQRLMDIQSKITNAMVNADGTIADEGLSGIGSMRLQSQTRTRIDAERMRNECPEVVARLEAAQREYDIVAKDYAEKYQTNAFLKFKKEK